MFEIKEKIIHRLTQMPTDKAKKDKKDINSLIFYLLLICVHLRASMDNFS